MFKTIAKSLFLAPLATLALSASAQELVNNGEFTTGNFTGWTVSGDAIVTTDYTPPSVGTEVVAFNSAETIPHAVLSQTLTTTIGQAYTFSFDYGTFGSGTVQTVDFSVTGTSTLASGSATAPDITYAPDYGSFSYNFTADSTSTTIAFTDAGSNVTHNEDGVLGDISVTPAPEPGTLALAGLGTLIGGTMIRRKSNA